MGTILFVIGITIAINIFIFLKVSPSRRRDLIQSSWKIFLFEEIIFLITLFLWSFIRAHEPSIHGLEKYMDFGFINSIIRSDYFPPVDMWFPPLPINYYYFGHLVTAVLTKLSTIPSYITYNLMLSTIFAFTFTASFSIGANLIYFLIFNSKFKNSLKIENLKLKILIGGLLTSFLVAFGGNLHAIYAFFKPYENESPVPFWQLVFAPTTFPNGYWYPNATRFIENTIHEFPVYSAVVSDLHGHYFDVPFVLLTIAILLSMFYTLFRNTKEAQSSKLKAQSYSLKLKAFVLRSFALCDLRFAILLGFILAIMYMTNAWDGIIYFLLTLLVFAVIYLKLKMKNSFQIENLKLKIFSWLFYISIIAVGFFIFSFPFNLHFKPFASGIGVLCAPEFLATIEKFGPFLFEKAHCQHSPWWQLLTLYGFFYFWAIFFLIFLIKKKNHKSQTTNHKQIQNYNIQNSKYFGSLNFDQAKPENLFRIWNLGFGILTKSDLFVLLLIIFSTLLIIIPEFIYVKDIYPGHYRANTMFKLVYQAFILLSISSAYIIFRLMPLILRNLRNSMPNIFNIYFVFFIFSILFFILVTIYPYLAINSYYGDLKTYHGLDGTKYLKDLYPTDYEAILWINKNVKGQPVILEAQGDSYTDYARVSSNTGLPTVLGWTVHEWLWRGSYDIPSPRIEDVQKMYESDDLEETKKLLQKHKVELVFFGDLERQKYPNLNEGKFKTLGKVTYENGRTTIYEIREL